MRTLFRAVGSVLAILAGSASAATLVFSTLFGGPGVDTIDDVATDTEGNVVVVGSATAPIDLAARRPDGTRPVPRPNAFAVKLDAAGSKVLWTTELGGRERETGLRVAIDSERHVYVAGMTSSYDLVATPGALRTSNAGTDDVFIGKLDGATGQPRYLTYLGGSNVESLTAFAVDGKGNAWIAGTTASSDFPYTQRPPAGSPGGAFVAKLDPAGAALVFAVPLGGTGFARPTGIAFDASGDAFVVGETSATDLPATAGVLSTRLSGPSDGFAMRLRSSGEMVWCSYFGGSNADEIAAVGVDAAGDVYLGGSTFSVDLPHGASGASRQFGGQRDAFVARLAPNGATLRWTMFLGGSGEDKATDLTLTSKGVAVTGENGSRDFPLSGDALGPKQAMANGPGGFISLVEPTGAALAYSSPFGGRWGDYPTAIASHASDVFLVGNLASAKDFPLTFGALKRDMLMRDGFLARIALEGAPPEAQRQVGPAFIQDDAVPLRESPDEAAKVLFELGIATEVEVRGEQGAFSDVRARAMQGWVKTAALGAAAPTVPALRTELLSATGERRLTLLRRLSALDPTSNDTLAELASALRAAGQVAAGAEWDRKLKGQAPIHLLGCTYISEVGKVSALLLASFERGRWTRQVKVMPRRAALPSDEGPLAALRGARWVKLQPEVLVPVTGTPFPKPAWQRFEDNFKGGADVVLSGIEFGTCGTGEWGMVNAPVSLPSGAEKSRAQRELKRIGRAKSGVTWFKPGFGPGPLLGVERYELDRPDKVSRGIRLYVLPAKGRLTQLQIETGYDYGA